MKKFISLFLSLIMILSSASVTLPVYAEQNDQITLAGVRVNLSGDSLKVVTNTSTSKKIGDKIVIFGPATNSNGETNVFDTDAYFDERAVIVNKSSTGDAETNDMRFQISMGGLNSGKATFVHDLYMASDDSCRMNLRLRSGSAYLSTVSFMDLGLNPFEWYTIKLTIDFESTSDNCKIEALKSDGSLFAEKVFSCNFTGKSLDNMFIWGTPKNDTMPDGAPDAIKDKLAFYAMKNLLVYHESGLVKAEILSVGSDGEVAYGQNEVSFKLSENIEGLTKDHVVVADGNGLEIKASEISVTQGSDEIAVTAVLEDNLAPETDYTLKLNPGCYSGYMEIYNGTVRNVTATEKSFYTTEEPQIDEPDINETTGTALASVKMDTNVLGLSVVEKNGVASTAADGKIIAFGAGKNTDGKSNMFSDESLFGTQKLFVNYSDTTSTTDLTNGPRMHVWSNSIAEGVAVFETEFYLACPIDNAYFSVGLRCDGRKSRDDKVVLSPDSNVYNLSPYKWYNLKIEVDYTKSSNNFSITIWDETASHTEVYTRPSTIESVDHFRLIGTPVSDEIGNNAPQELNAQKAFFAFDKMITYQVNGEVKAAVTQIADNFVAQHGVNTLEFKLSNAKDNLSAENITVKSESGKVIKVKEISVQELGGESVVNAVLDSNLTPWTTYSLILSADIYNGYLEYNNGKFAAVTPIVASFSTPAAPFDIKEPVFTSDADKLLVSADLINTTGTPEDVSFVFSVFSGGRQKSITSKSYPMFEATYPGETLEHETNIANGDVAKFFVINGWENPAPLFDKSWAVDSVGNHVSVESVEAATLDDDISFTAGEFDYAEKKIKISHCATSDGATNAAIIVYKKGNAPSDTNLPVFIDCVTTAADGSFEYEILFNQNLDYGEYTVAYYPAEGTYESCEFTYYTESQLLEIAKENLYTNAKGASNSGVLMQVIKGIDSNEDKINDNFDIFSADADMSKYEKLKDKDSVFALMYKKLSSAYGYNELVELFEKCASELYKKENTSTSSPSSNNKNYGSSSVAVKESNANNNQVQNDSKPDSENTNSNTSSDETAFLDMQGHWADKSVTELCKKGIMNGYEDGTFRADNNITRAELSKILVLAFASEGSYNNDFSDITGNEWYASFVAGAKHHGIINGYENGSFAPQSFVSRQDAALMLYRAIKLVKEVPTGYKLFADDLDISAYATDATRALGELGILGGNPDGSFKPLNNITRAEVAAIVCRAFDFVQSH